MLSSLAGGKRQKSRVWPPRPTRRRMCPRKPLSAASKFHSPVAMTTTTMAAAGVGTAVAAATAQQVVVVGTGVVGTGMEAAAEPLPVTAAARTEVHVAEDLQGRLAEGGLAGDVASRLAAATPTPLAGIMAAIRRVLKRRHIVTRRNGRYVRQGSLLVSEPPCDEQACVVRLAMS
jgi:hypothetical protein